MDNKKRYEAIIFDLDGTLIDTSLGIINSVRYAEKKMNLLSVPDQEVLSFLGPPPKEQYKRIYHLGEQEALMAATYHREYGSNFGIFESKVYQGIEELLKGLKEKGYKLAVATLKRNDIANDILSNYSLASYFDLIMGMNDGEDMSKKDLICEVCNKMKISKSEAVLIGDSSYDALGASEAGIDFIGVLYGFGFHSKDEVESYKCAQVCESVDELIGLLLN